MTSRLEPWLVSARFDLGVFLAPTLLAVALVGLREPLAPSGELPMPGWVLGVLLVDVAHVWATLRRTYLDPEARARWPRLLIAVPILGFAAGVVLHVLGPRWFWGGLAYLAVWHFIRQQVGWVALYQRRAGEAAGFWTRFDRAAVYVAAGAPIVFWHLVPPRRFDWFVPGDFVTLGSAPEVAVAVMIGAATLLAGYAVVSAARARRTGRYPVGKWVVVATTAVCWTLGIVLTDDDWSFTWTNILIHGVPYVAFVWVHAGPARARPGAPPWWRSLAAFGGLLVGLAWVEEYAWDRLIWHDHAALFPGPALDLEPGLQALVVPLLALPQLTHYVLDAWIWRTRDPGNAVLRELTAPAWSTPPALTPSGR